METKTLQRFALLSVFGCMLTITPVLADSYNKPVLRIMPAASVINVPSLLQPPYRLAPISVGQQSDQVRTR